MSAMFIENTTTMNSITEEFISQLTSFIKKEEHKDVNESVVEFSACRFDGDEGATIFMSDSKISEMALLAYVIPYKKTFYKTRKIILRPEKDGTEMKISLHEIFLNERGGDEVRKRKFRFYVRAEDIGSTFIEQCKKYLLNRISNQDVIKSIKHSKSNGLVF